MEPSQPHLYKVRFWTILSISFIHSVIPNTIIYVFPTTNFKKPSTYRIAAPDGIFSRTIGHGLFSSIPYPKNKLVAKFVGELISEEIYDQRDLSGQGGYAIQIKGGVILDCFPFLHTCMASFANSPKNAWDTTTKRMARQNCKIKVNTTHATATLWTTRYIAPHTEMSWSYQGRYRFPI